MTYDYICTACGNLWEAEQRISEDPLKDCPSCGAAAAKRQISGGAGFILKGGGWYSDLYSSPGSSGAKSVNASTSSSSSTSSEKSPCASGACGTSACPAASSSS